MGFVKGELLPPDDFLKLGSPLVVPPLNHQSFGFGVLLIVFI
jgi:hypothetical protein